MKPPTSSGKRCVICVASEPSVGRSARLFVAGMKYERIVEGEQLFPHICATHRRQIEEEERRT